MSHDLTRGLLHKNFWVMEQQSGAGGWQEMGPSPRPGQVRLYTYQSIAHGADGIIYFRWRVCRSGIEQYWHGILDHDGSTNRRYEEIKGVGAEVAKLWPLLEGTEVPAEVAIVNDCASRWAWQSQKSNSEFSYYQEAMHYYRSFFSRGVPVDVPQIGDDLSGYKIVVVPAMFIVTPERAEQLKNYVADGGTLVVTYRTAAKDATSLMVNEPLPGMLRDLFGVRVAEYHSPFKEEENFIKGVAAGLPTERLGAQIFLDVLKPEGAEVLAEYVDGFAAGLPAVTMNTYGNGRAVYVGTHPDLEFVEALIAMLAEKSGVELGAKLPDDVEIAIRRSGERELVFVMNYAREPRKVTVPKGARAVIGPDGTGEIEIEPYGVRVFER
jgi:beta-galactosidase